VLYSRAARQITAQPARSRRNPAWEAPDTRPSILTLWPGWTIWLNTVTWQDAPSFVVGHPDDACLLEQLTCIDHIAAKLERLGPYRDRHIQGLFSDFL
jgi:hypothetical protein